MFRLKNQSKFIKILLLVLLTIFVVSKTLALVHAISHQQFSTVEINSKEAKKDCQLCDFANFQNQFFGGSLLNFSSLFFAVIFAWRKFDRVKLSYLLCCYSSRAPPAIS